MPDASATGLSIALKRALLDQGGLFMVLRTVGGKPLLFIIVLEHCLGTLLASTSG